MHKIWVSNSFIPSTLVRVELILSHGQESPYHVGLRAVKTMKQLVGVGQVGDGLAIVASPTVCRCDQAVPV